MRSRDGGFHGEQFGDALHGTRGSLHLAPDFGESSGGDTDNLNTYSYYTQRTVVGAGAGRHWRMADEVAFYVLLESSRPVLPETMESLKQMAAGAPEDSMERADLEDLIDEVEKKGLQSDPDRKKTMGHDRAAPVAHAVSAGRRCHTASDEWVRIDAQPPAVSGDNSV